jgi:RHS repeat-associated protein
LSAGTTDNGQPTTDQCAVLPDESYSYDANGNRTSATFGTSTSAYVIGPGNEILSDGTYTYTYDAEGNRTARFIDTNADGALDSGDTSVTIYGWDNRNRLVSVTSYAAYGDAPTQTVTYSYDAQNRWIGETVTNADGSMHRTAFAYDVLSPLPLGEGQGEGGQGPGAGQIVLQFDGQTSVVSGQSSVADGATSSPIPNPQSPIPSLTVNDLSHRYLWGPAVDQILADEQLPAPPSGSLPTANCPPPTVVWPLTDNQGTVRDLAVYNAQTGVTSVANHRVYDSYGNLESQTNAAVDCLFGFTGLPYDEASGTYVTPTRRYAPATGGWLGQDWIGLTGGDTNLYRYAGNSPTNAMDPTGQGSFWNWWVWGQWSMPDDPGGPAAPPASGPTPIPTEPGPDTAPAPLIPPPHVPPWLPPLIPGVDPTAETLEIAGEAARVAILAKLRENWARSLAAEDLQRYNEACRYFAALKIWEEQNHH